MHCHRLQLYPGITHQLNLTLVKLDMWIIDINIYTLYYYIHVALNSNFCFHACSIRTFNHYFFPHRKLVHNNQMIIIINQPFNTMLRS